MLGSFHTSCSKRWRTRHATLLLLLLLMLMLLLSRCLLLLLQRFPETKALSESGIYIGRQTTPAHIPGQGTVKAVVVELMLLGVNESRRAGQGTGSL